MRLRAIQRGDAGNRDVSVADQATADLLCNGSGGDGHRPITAVTSSGSQLARHAVGGFLV